MTFEEGLHSLEEIFHDYIKTEVLSKVEVELDLGERSHSRYEMILKNQNGNFFVMFLFSMHFSPLLTCLFNFKEKIIVSHNLFIHLDIFFIGLPTNKFIDFEKGTNLIIFSNLISREKSFFV